MILRNSIAATLLVATLLLSACSDPAQPTITLAHAARDGNLEQLERHVFWDTDLNQADDDGQTAMHLAAARGRLVVLRELIKGGADASLQDAKGLVPLDHAVLNGRLLVVRTMLEGLTPEQLFEQGQRLAQNGITDKRILSEFLERGMDINAADDNGDGLLHLAARGHHRRTVRLLLDNGAHPDMKNSAGDLAADIAKRNGDETIYFILTKR